MGKGVVVWCGEDGWEIKWLKLIKLWERRGGYFVGGELNVMVLLR
jgi:hypothetical protein